MFSKEDTERTNAQVGALSWIWISAAATRLMTKTLPERHISKTCWPFVVTKITILQEKMSQLAEVHQQVAPIRTARALPLGSVTPWSPNCLFSKPSNVYVSASQYSKVILRSERSSRNLDETGFGSLKTVDWQDSYYFVCVSFHAQSRIEEVVRGQRNFIYLVGSMLDNSDKYSEIFLRSLNYRTLTWACF